MSVGHGSSKSFLTLIANPQILLKRIGTESFSLSSSFNKEFVTIVVTIYNSECIIKAFIN